jgi:hypothetical protein
MARECAGGEAPFQMNSRALAVRRRPRNVGDTMKTFSLLALVAFLFAGCAAHSHSGKCCSPGSACCANKGECCKEAK